MLRFILHLLMLGFIACSPENYSMKHESINIPDIAISIGANASDIGPILTFENGDKVGVIILDSKGNILCNNIPYEYNNNQWIFFENNNEEKKPYINNMNAKNYIVYYPYDSIANGINNIDSLKKRFSPQIDQRLKSDYRKSDLLVSCSDIKNTQTLDAKLSHAYASVSFSPSIKCTLQDKNKTPISYLTLNLSDVNFTINNNIYYPYQAADSSFRCILPASFTSGDICCFCTLGEQTYCCTVNISKVEPNERYVFPIEIDLGEYNYDKAQVGDFYCKNDSNKGYLIPGEIASLSDSITCLGIVMKVGKDDNGNWCDHDEYYTQESTGPMSTVHGYVLALHDCQSCVWSDKSIKLDTDQSSNLYFVGYANTQIIKKNELVIYSKLVAYENTYNSPLNSSGWFIPSAGQCRYWYLNKDVLLLGMKKARGDKWNNSYWSSSEDLYDPLNKAWVVNFSSAEIESNKKEINHQVRPCLVF